MYCISTMLRDCIKYCTGFVICISFSSSSLLQNIFFTLGCPFRLDACNLPVPEKGVFESEEGNSKRVDGCVRRAVGDPKLPCDRTLALCT